MVTNSKKQSALFILGDRTFNGKNLVPGLRKRIKEIDFVALQVHLLKCIERTENARIITPLSATIAAVEEDVYLVLHWSKTQPRAKSEDLLNGICDYFRGELKKLRHKPAEPHVDNAIPFAPTPSYDKKGEVCRKRLVYIGTVAEGAVGEEQVARIVAHIRTLNKEKMANRSNVYAYLYNIDRHIVLEVLTVIPVVNGREAFEQVNAQYDTQKEAIQAYWDGFLYGTGMTFDATLENAWLKEPLALTQAIKTYREGGA